MPKQSEYVKRLRFDLRQERIKSENYKRAHLAQQKKAGDLAEENKRLRKQNNDLKRENNKLKKEIEKLTKTNNRYQISLFDHGNFKHPQKGEKKAKGGQLGHKDTNKDKEMALFTFEEMTIYAEVCGKCGKGLNRCAGIKKKTLIDIQLNPEFLKLIVLSERQWCSNCQQETRSVHPQALPFTEYGINTFMTVMYLRFKGKQSLRTIAITLNNIFGLPIRKSGVDTLLFQGQVYLKDKYEALKEAIRTGEIMYNDETGWMVRGKTAWMWIMATADQEEEDGTIKAGMTVYVAAESRGKGIFVDMYGKSKAKSMHDGYSSYVSVTGESNTAYCWSHVLRFAYEECVNLSKEHPACKIRDKLVEIYQTIRGKPERVKGAKEQLLRNELNRLLATQSEDETVKNILQRIKIQKEGLILALLITKDGTNNLAERELRPLAISRNISYGSDTYTGMERTAILSSLVQTISRDKTKPFFKTLSFYLYEGIKKQYPQYQHIPHFTS